MLTCLLELPCAAEESAETHVAVSGERLHSEFASEPERMTVRSLRALEVRWIATRENVAEEPERTGLRSPLLELASEIERALSEPRGFVRTGEEQMGAAEKQE